MPARFEKIGDPHAAIDQHAGSIEGLLELFERQGLGDAPWPPHYRNRRRSLLASSHPSANAPTNTR